MKKEIITSALSNLKQAFNTSIDYFGFSMLIYTALSEEKEPLLYFGIIFLTSTIVSIAKKTKSSQQQ